MTFSFKTIINSPENPIGNIAFFHPGGLKAKGIPLMAENFPNHNFIHIELRLVPSFMNSFNSEGNQLYSLAQIAEEIIAEIYKDDDLPSLFLGWSLGGILAFETAHLWKGEKKPDLCFLDSTGLYAVDHFLSLWFGKSKFDHFLKRNNTTILSEVDSSEWFSYANKEMNLDFIGKYFIMYLNELKGIDIPLDAPKTDHIDESSLIHNLMEKAIAYGGFDKSLSFDGFYKVYETYKEGIVKSMALIASSQNKYYGGELLFFKAENNYRNTTDEPTYTGWEQLFSEVSSVPVPCNHYEILTTEVIEKYVFKEVSIFFDKIEIK